ncbi:gluconate 2-dehydrogenase, cytochrome c subunit [Neoasaia chiangmaiensis NBRC 101099]|uniref:Alcohol dehydrogenase n=1 Tax=Neoasaia chiangmaiensis TaxID=320497 RepID=A0A1U9KQA1_9PROT|nr:cytochrome c [Neoasaia chiangmaiensis]AQS87899.1 alcohol dehydrogenase [Neoasaia chiangmaiensis]GBR39148.1 gluconate 2-dehydrogenase, cytochrome c subunit [Neoasaia chiangmaiensis NBRC 101099]GEN15546.1 cytochrome c [Neoasaia chiangmaiensis]
MKKTLSLLGSAIALIATAAHAQTQPPADNDLVAQGQYIAAAADCSACHTLKGGMSYAGGTAFKLPIGTIYAPNITPDREHGIGAYTEAEFSRALREGVRRDGSSLYPAMPYPSYARMTDRDIHALYVYFQHGVAPVASSPPANGISWPLSMRWPMTIWRSMFSPDVRKAQLNVQREFEDSATARGAYLVEGPAHCGACHTPRAVTMQEKALSNADGNIFLSGGDTVDGFIPVNLRQDNRTGLGRWTEDDIVAFLATGRNRQGESFGSMSEAIEHGTQHLSDADLHAIAKYLLTLTPRQPNAAAWTYDKAAADALQHGDASARGARVYVDHCEACHRSDGHGYAPTFPPLAGNPVVMSDAPDSLVHIVQSGAALPGMEKAPSSFVMPSFSRNLTNQQIADVVTFIRHAWGNNAAEVDAATVAKLAKSAPTPVLKNPPIPLN